MYQNSTACNSVGPDSPQPLSLSTAVRRLDSVIDHLNGLNEQSGAYADILGGRPGASPAMNGGDVLEKSPDSTVGQLNNRLDRIMDIIETHARNISRIGNAIG